MNARLKKQFDKIETDRKNLFNELKAVPDDILNKAPREGAWSAAEVIAHLMTAEEMSLKYLQKKTIDTSTAKPEGLKNKWRWFLVQVVFNFDIKFKAPEIVTPKMGYQTKADLEKKWSDIRSQTAVILDKLTDRELNTQLWKHAVAGKMNLHHMVEFFGVHFNRHKKQIERTLKAVV